MVSERRIVRQKSDVRSQNLRLELRLSEELPGYLDTGQNVVMVAII